MGFRARDQAELLAKERALEVSELQAENRRLLEEVARVARDNLRLRREAEKRDARPKVSEKAGY